MKFMELLEKMNMNVKKPKVRILVADDHPLVRRGMTDLVNQEEDLTVCGEAGSGQETLRLAADLEPDLILLDLSLGDINGIEIIKKLKAEHPEILILVFSMHDEALYAERSFRAGARGYLMKQEPAGRVLEAIRKILAGGIYLGEKLNDELLMRLVQGKDSTPRSSIEGLSDRELEVLRLVGMGLKPRAIAEKLCVSVRTVESHRASIRAKLKLKSAADLVQYAIKWHHREEL